MTIKPNSPDRSLFLIALSLVALGVVMVFSASAVMAREKYGDAGVLAFRQMMAGALGLAFMFVLMKVDYHVYRKPVFVFTILSIVIGLCVVVFFLPETQNTHRWIQFPGISFQPSETAKLALVIFLAYFLEMRRGHINEAFTLVPVGVVVGIFTAVICLQRDLGTAVAILITACVLLYASGLNMRWIGIGSLAAVPLGYIAFYFLVYMVPYRWDRIIAFWDPESDPKGKGFQILQSIIAFGTGGINGLGFMESKQKLGYLPAAQTDFIFAVIGEELGLIGTIFVLALFGAFLWRGLKASLNAPDLFGFYLALGITMTVAVQAFINMSVVLGLVPNKGIPLPFLSYGGSSFLVTLVAVGILLNVSQQARRAEASK